MVREEQCMFCKNIKHEKAFKCKVCGYEEVDSSAIRRLFGNKIISKPPWEIGGFNE